MKTSYQTDFSLWMEETTHCLREKNWDELDVPHLIEEVMELGKSERRGIASQLVRLLLHLLKWQQQPQRRSDSWLDLISDARLQIELAMDDSPSLKGYPKEQINMCYAKARKGAAKQTGLPESDFPVICPYSLEEILQDNWLPGQANGE